MRFHWQNLNEDGLALRNSRCWFYFGKDSNLEIDWSFFSKRFGIDLGLGHYDCAISFGIRLGIINLYFELDNPSLERWILNATKRKDQKYGHGREIGFSIHHGALWVDLWNDPMESRRADPRWWHFSFHPRDFFLGRSVYSEKIIEEREVVVPMPEKSYAATARLYKSYWKRPRWFKESVMRVDIKVPEGIPFEGKGENSWDCGQDATYSMTCAAKSIPEAVGKLVGSVLRDRVKNGGWSDWNWQKSTP